MQDDDGFDQCADAMARDKLHKIAQDWPFGVSRRRRLRLHQTVDEDHRQLSGHDESNALALANTYRVTHAN